MLPIVDIHCHYLAGQEGAIDGFRRLVESPEVHRVAVCALDLKLPYSADFPFMSVFSTTNEQ